MPGRHFSAGGYRYGFNGKENDPESGTQDYGMRIYDNRLGRFLSTDPITSQYPELTPYQFAGNGPIVNIDLDGLEPFPFQLLDDLVHNYEKTVLKGGEDDGIITSMKSLRAYATKLTVEGFARETVEGVEGMTKQVQSARAGNLSKADLANIAKDAGTHPFAKIAEKKAEGIVEGDFVKMAEADAEVMQIGLFAASGVVDFKPKPRPLKNIEIGTDLGTRTASYNTKPLIDVYNIFGHTEGKLFWIDGKTLGAGEFYKMMLEKGYKPGSDINLYSCHSASNGLAQEIANLSRAKLLKAPTGVVNPLKGGNIAEGTTGIPGSEVKPFTAKPQ